jgi:hypothetical protein
VTVIRPMKLDEIEEHLMRLGAGNHSDNMARLRQYQCYLCMAMNEDDFLSTVFLQNEEVLTIAPRGDSRSLRKVARRAIDSKLRVLSSNWDLNTNLERMRRQRASGGICLDSPDLCETRTSEKNMEPGTSKTVPTGPLHMRCWSSWMKCNMGNKSHSVRWVIARQQPSQGSIISMAGRVARLLAILPNEASTPKCLRSLVVWPLPRRTPGWFPMGPRRSQVEQECCTRHPMWWPEL